MDATQCNPIKWYQADNIITLNKSCSLRLAWSVGTGNLDYIIFQK
jgi:hypothetical protein